MSDREDRFLLLEALRDFELDGRVAVFENLDWPTWNELFTRARQIRADLLKMRSPYLSLAMQWARAHNKAIVLTDEQQSLMTEVQWHDAADFMGRAYTSAFKEREQRVH